MENRKRRNWKVRLSHSQKSEVRLVIKATFQLQRLKNSTLVWKLPEHLALASKWMTKTSSSTISRAGRSSSFNECSLLKLISISQLCNRTVSDRFFSMTIVAYNKENFPFLSSIHASRYVYDIMLLNTKELRWANAWRVSCSHSPYFSCILHRFRSKIHKKRTCVKRSWERASRNNAPNVA